MTGPSESSEALRKTPCRVARAAELLGKTIEATYQDVARGRLPHRRIGRSLYFFEEEIVDFLDRQPGLRVETSEEQGAFRVERKTRGTRQ